MVEELSGTRPDLPLRFRAGVLASFPPLVAELGGDPDRLLSEAGLSIRDLADPERLLPGRALAVLLSAAVRATGCGHFGALLASRHELRTYLGALGRLVWAAPDLRSAVQEFTAHIAVHVEGSHWALDVDGELCRLRNAIDAAPLQEQAVAHNLVFVNRLLRAITANRWAPELVYFSTRRPDDIRFLKRFFGCPIVFDSDCNALVFHSSDLDTPLPTADEQLSAILHRLGPFAGDDSARDLVDEVAKLVEKNLLSGIRSIDSVVRFLPYSRSTLQKKLAERGTSYQRILDGVRDRRARQYLVSSDLSIAELSEMLAYESQEAFSRAFKARLGEPPSAWRRSNRRR